MPILFFPCISPAITKPHYKGLIEGWLSCSQITFFQLVAIVSSSPPSISHSPLGTVFWKTTPRRRKETAENRRRYSRSQVRLTTPELVMFRSVSTPDYHRPMSWDIYLELRQSPNIFHRTKRRHRDSNLWPADTLALESSVLLIPRPKYQFNTNTIEVHSLSLCSFSHFCF